jgi:menaquinone-dependent protoporphyrinogen oxidase
LSFTPIYHKIGLALGKCKKGVFVSKHLITYVSKKGSTREIAERLSEAFSKSGLEVTLLPLANVQTLEGYDSVILGSPINGMQLLPEFVEFVKKNPALSGKVLGFFVVSYLYKNGRRIWRRAMDKSIDTMKEQLKPEMSAIFGGKLAEKMPGPANLLFGIKSTLPLDLRNWTEIDEWADLLVRMAQRKAKGS